MWNNSPRVPRICGDANSATYVGTDREMMLQ